MNNNPLTAGSPLWQTVFVSFAAAFILLEVLRGWRLGLPRQLVRLAAVIGAYATAYFGGRAAAPYLRDTIKAPDLILSSIAGAVLALLVYVTVTGIGTILFKRTDQHASRAVRLAFGASGAVCGIFFGLFFIWLILIGVRSVGAIADAQVRSQARRSVPFQQSRARQEGEYHSAAARPAAGAEALTALLARLKNSVELGPIGEAVRKTDAMPTGVYQTIGKVGEVFATPASAERFLAYPGARALAQHPKIVALQNDPAIGELVSQGRFLDLMRNERLIDALNDPTLLDRVKHFDLDRALDYALQRN